MFNSPSLTYTLESVKKIHTSQDSSHDFLHIKRVLDNAIHLNSYYRGDSELIAYLSILHDIEDEKLNTNVEIKEILEETDLSVELKNQIINLCKLISFSNFVNLKDECIEVQIVSDADKLDAIGAIGIARAFAYGNNKKRPFYYSKDEKLIGENDATIDHFQHKLLHIDQYLYTEKAKLIAKERIKFLRKFVKRFYSEINIIESS